MKRYFLAAMLCLLILAPAGRAQNRDIIEMKQSLALLQGMVRELQRNFDEKIAVMRTLVEQSTDQVAKLNNELAAVQQSVQVTVGNAGQ
ncbi:MAG TPA: hypothetical protein VNN17_11245, partial [Terriglobia bacterium]|nr:hypothetical protein [Terriglobia bacterium]